MATFETFPLSVEPTSRNVRLLRSLGTMGLMASPTMLLAMASTGFGKSGTASPWVGLLGIVYCIGWLASLAGLYLTGALGRGHFGRRVLGVQALLVAVAAAWSVGEVVVPRWEQAGFVHAIGDAAWPLSHLAMVGIGLLTLRARSWTGWVRVTPLLCGLALPFAFLTNLASWERAMSLAFGVWTCGAFAMLGWSVRTSGARLQPARHSTGSS
jgi:hypothetical protein